MRSTLLGLLLVLVSVFWPGQGTAMAAADDQPDIELASFIDPAQATTCIAPDSDTESTQLLGHLLADLPCDNLDCLGLISYSSTVTALPQGHPQGPQRVAASRWPDAPQRPPCACAA